MRSERELHLSEFYASLVMLADRLNGTRSLSNCTGRDGWPTHGTAADGQAAGTIADRYSASTSAAY
jgi:hypothetical protein